MTNDQPGPDDTAASQPDDKERPKNRGAGNTPKKAWQRDLRASKAEAVPNVIAPVENSGALRLPGGAARQLELLLASRENQLRRFLLRVGVFVLLPGFIVWCYTMFIATPRYECDYQITYQSYQPGNSLAGGISQTSFGSTETDSIDYGTILYEYVGSLALAEQVDKLLDLRSHYSASNIDWFSRLSRHATQKQFLNYWQSHVSISEGFGGYLTISVQGFDPQFTLKIAQTINKLSDQMIDQLSYEARTSEVNSAKQQLAIATAELQKADDLLTTFRNTNGDLDPSFMATEIGTIEATLDGQLATLKAQLGQEEANVLPSSPIIVQLKLQISALEAQIQAERVALANNNGQPNYSDTVAKYEDALTNQLLASSVYQAAQQGLVLAQADAAQKQNYVVAFVPPVLPDLPTEPSPLIDTSITLLACIGIYGIGNLLVSAFRDQAGI